MTTLLWLLLTLGGSPTRDVVRIPTPTHRLHVVTVPAPTRTRPGAGEVSYVAR